MTNKPVILGGTPIIEGIPEELFHWPIVTKEDEDAVLDVLRRGAMSGTDVTRQFEDEFKKWQGREYAVGANNGTAAVLGALWACGVGAGDEVIGPSLTYWASMLPVYQLGATPVFADVDPETLCISPSDIERRITGRTKVIMVVQYLGHPAEMDAIMEIAERRG
ncbi:MAG: DegT/DnrJ/EryC1/StrS family aminotransferase, partial [Defluviitaleaceae bacterium]|nr:DegT/DnrJ/EryC1/StrS family aminotransferase [Defluviitaleaceae bacterium]